ncbi:MAG: S53 family peptidase [Labilithrix sp.]
MKTKLLSACSSLAALTIVAGACAPEERLAERAEAVTEADDVTTKEACPTGRFRCFAKIQTETAGGSIKRFAAPSGFGPAELADAYELDTSVDPGATIAIIDAFGYPNVEADLAAYRARYGLPPCTVASGCLRIVNQRGTSAPLPPPPSNDNDWMTEQAIDLDLASAACPKCKLLLVQTENDHDTGLFEAQQVAARLGATVISNSWGNDETAVDLASTYEHFFAVTPAVGIFASSGDSGYDSNGHGPHYPATSAYVTAVGATTLRRSATDPRGWTEWAWGGWGGHGSGSACSLSVPKPAWQGETACRRRASADISAIGDPSTGLAVYTSKQGGWIVTGGTSAATPFVAGVYALTGHGKVAPSFAYDHPGAFFDVTVGANGACRSVLCKSGPGWDGPTGLGTPNGSALRAATCTPSCAGRSCGNDGCGGSCGACGGASYCSATGQCVAACVPSCAGRVCGNDGCGGSCGGCGDGKVCDGSGRCVACSPTCDGTRCLGPDGCGGTCRCRPGTACAGGVCY